MKNFFIRTISGIIYIFFIILGILHRHTFFIVFSIITFLCLHEFYSIVNIKQKINTYYLYCLGGVLLFVTAYLYTSGVFPYSSIFLFYLLYIVFISILEFYKKNQNFTTYITLIFLGQCYVALPLSLLNAIVFTKNIYSYTLLLALFVFIWVSDSIAYIIGTNFGKHQLFKRISPKKSWEGFVGGLIFTIASSFVFAYYFSNISLYHWIGIATVITIFSTLGDLIESLIKRILGIKDSGHVIPGHGGFLDRFDSLLFAIYALLFYIKWFIQ